MPDRQPAAKLLLCVGQDYVFSTKRTSEARDDGRLELLGGRIEEGESPDEGLRRELAEEETSGTLTSILARAGRPSRVVAKKRVQWVFRLSIDESEWEKLSPSEESYGFVRVPQSDVEGRAALAETIGDYTRMTQKIFAELGMVRRPSQPRDV